MTNKNEYNPDFVTSPAETLEEMLPDLDIDAIPIKAHEAVIDVMCKNLPITPEIAKLLEQATSAPANFWLDRQRRYDESQKPQRQVYNNVAARGYTEGWTDEQFAARQVAKMQEELGELSYLFSGEPTIFLDSGLQERLFDLIDDAGAESGRMFDNHGEWKNAAVSDIERAKKELADIQVVVFCLAEALSKLDAGAEPFDVVATAVEKSGEDVERGVRV